MAFSKGSIPWNKGIKIDREKYPGMGHLTSHSDLSKEKISKNRTGLTAKEKNPAWKGGLRSANYVERRKFRSTMQKLIFERDNYTCQLCGGRQDLQVDHIQPWAEYVELRFKIENCRTLCASCHYEITFKKPMPLGIKAWGHNLMQKGGD